MSRQSQQPEQHLEGELPYQLDYIQTYDRGNDKKSGDIKTEQEALDCAIDLDREMAVCSSVLLVHDLVSF